MKAFYLFLLVFYLGSVVLCVGAGFINYRAALKKIKEVNPKFKPPKYLDARIILLLFVPTVFPIVNTFLGCINVLYKDEIVGMAVINEIMGD